VIAFSCVQCGKSLSFDDEMAGSNVNCPECSKPITIPASNQELPSAISQSGRLPPIRLEATPPTKPAPFDAEVSATSKVPSLEASPRPGPSAADDDSEVLTSFLAPPQAQGEIGRLGPYRVLAILGRGGMGVVFRAQDPQLQRPVALKALLPSLAASRTAKERFFREARAAAALKHPHVVTIHQVGEDRSAPFLAMEFLEGESLDSRLLREVRLPLPEILRISKEIAEGLEAAHERGLIHRDIKPGNIWLEGKKGHVKILDFGLARAISDDVHLTQTGAVVGTPAFMAPEQAAGEPIDHRSDLFSLGCVLYRMSTGQMPFKGENTYAILSALQRDNPAPPSALNWELSKELSDLIMRLLAKKPEDRPPSAGTLAAELAAMAQSMPLALPHSGHLTSPPASGILLEGHATFSTLPLTPRLNRRQRVRVGAAIALGVLLVAGAAFGGYKLFTSGKKDVAAPLPADPETVIAVAPKVESKEETAAKDPDRRAAEYVLSIGGTVRVQYVYWPYENIAQLPKSNFHLEMINLDKNAKVTDAGLACFKGYKHLKEIFLNDTSVGDEGISYFKENTKLGVLQLGGTKVSDTGLSNFKECKSLVTLQLENLQIGDAGIANFKGCNSITELWLSSTNVSDTALAYFKYCRNLESLRLGKTKITDAGLYIFKDCNKLRALDLSDTNATDAGLAHFKDCRKLTDLRLAKTRITDVGFAYFKDNNLKRCDLSGTRVTDSGVAQLKNCKELISLKLKETVVTPKTIDELQKALPLCKIEWDGGSE